MTATPADSAKPTAQQIGWDVAPARVEFRHARFDVRTYRIDLPNGGDPVDYAVVERAAGVVIVPVTPAGEIVLIRQYRFPVDRWCLETPAGSTSDTGSMPLEDVARKELEEEVGGRAGRLERLGEFFSAPAYSTERCVAFLAWDVELSGGGDCEPTEKIVIEVVPATEAFRLAETGGIHTAPCAVALLLARPVLRVAGFAV